MNIWVEWFQHEISEKNTSAQMREQLKWKPPSSTEIHRRFFDKQKEAAEFAKRMNDEGYHASIKRDGVGHG